MDRRIIALLAGVAAFALVAAAAASLGGLNTSGVGADAEVVAACTSSGFDVAFTTGYDDTVAGGTAVTTVTLTESAGATACDGLEADLVLLDRAPGDGGNVLAQVSATVAGDTAVFELAPGISAQALQGIAASIAG